MTLRQVYFSSLLLALGFAGCDADSDGQNATTPADETSSLIGTQLSSQTEGISTTPGALDSSADDHACSVSQALYALQILPGGEIEDGLALTRWAYGSRSLMIGSACDVALTEAPANAVMHTTLSPQEYTQIETDLDIEAFSQRNGQEFGYECEDGFLTVYRTPRGTITCRCGCDPARLPDELAGPVKAFDRWAETLWVRSVPHAGDVGVAAISSTSPQWHNYTRYPTEAFMETDLAFDWETIARLEDTRVHRVSDAASSTQLRNVRDAYEAWKAGLMNTRIPEGLILLRTADDQRFAVSIAELASSNFDVWR